MKQYQDDLRTILKHGTPSTDRTGTGTISYFGLQTRYDLADGFPAQTTKKLHLKSIIHELLWFLSGDTNIRYLKENGVSIWDEWADENGELGPVYGRQWRMFRGEWQPKLGLDTSGNPVDNGGYQFVDQISNLIDMIRKTPDSRRLIVTGWNPADVPQMTLPPCHTMWQLRIQDAKLHLQLYQRSGDMLLGVPFNIFSYSLLLMMIAHVTGYEPGTFIHSIGDAHIYNNHIEQVHTVLNRTPHKLPTMHIRRQVTDIFDFRYDDFELRDYNPDPHISAPVAV